jgi:hypothetical protein
LADWIPGRLRGRVFKSGPIGLGAARAELVNRARTEFCACVDADDVNEPDRLECQIAFLRARPDVALVGSAVSVINGDGRPTGRNLDYPLDHRDIAYSFITWNPIGQPAVAFRRAAVLEVGNYDDEAPVEDYDLWLRLSARYRLANLPERLVRYRMHPTSHTRRLEAAGALDERLARTFVRDAPAVFGLKPVAARRLLAGRAYGTLACAFAISRRVARVCREPRWTHLRDTRLIATLRSMTHPRDVGSRIALAALDRRPGTLRHETRVIGGQVLRKFPFGAGIAAALAKLFPRRP